MPKRFGGEEVKQKLLLVYTVLCIALASLAVYLIVHEATHLALSSQPEGVCFGLCRPDSGQPERIAFGLAYAKQHNDLSRREDIPWTMGIVFTVLFSFIGLKYLCKQSIQSA